MLNIKILPPALANKIAAGEVVERPVSVVKELVENAMDAGATKIIVEIRKGGIEQIRVSDNGSGILRNAVDTAFLRHATSKISNDDDLHKIATMGFRGEALSSICAVSEVTLTTRTSDEEIGARLTITPELSGEIEDAGCNVGTAIVVSRLFANVPARMKFLKRDATEAAYITDVLGKIALSAPAISFKYSVDGEMVFATSGDGDLRSAIFEIYGKDCAKALIELDYAAGGIKIHGQLGTAEISRGNRARQTIFVNGRYVKNYALSKVVEDAYKTRLTVGKFPFFVVNIEVPYDSVDVNVHPAKTEVKFADERYVCREVYHAAKAALDYASVNEDDTEHASIVKNVAAAEFAFPQIVKDAEITDSVGAQEVLRVSDSATEKNDDYDTKYDKFKTEQIVVPQSEDNFVGEVFFRPQTADVQNVKPMPEDTPRRIIGQIFETYIIAESGNQVCIIDQHAAHERINYERVMARLRARERVEGQMLLTPEIIRFTAIEKAGILENIDVFSSLGFEIEDFGASDVIVRQVPVPQSVDVIKENILHALKLLERHGTADVTDVREKVLHRMACGQSVRAGKKLSVEEMEELLKQVDNLGGNVTCPHGRPIKVALTKPELEKMFMRG